MKNQKHVFVRVSWLLTTQAYVMFHTMPLWLVMLGWYSPMHPMSGEVCSFQFCWKSSPPPQWILLPISKNLKINVWKTGVDATVHRMHHPCVYQSIKKFVTLKKLLTSHYWAWSHVFNNFQKQSFTVHVFKVHVLFAAVLVCPFSIHSWVAWKIKKMLLPKRFSILC